MVIPADIGELSQWLQVVAMLATVIWAVSRIKNTTDKLSLSMDHLRATVQRLDLRSEAFLQDIARVKERLSIVETRQSIVQSEVDKVKGNSK